MQVLPMMLYGLRHWPKTRQTKQTTLSSSKTHLLGLQIRIAAITGNTSLDRNGDRKYGDYEYWTVIKDKNNSGSYKWTTIGKFVYEKSSNDHN